MENIKAHKDEINAQLARYGVKFGVYKNGVFNERLFPFDPIPRIIEGARWEVLEKGLIQRVTALNLYLADVYGEGRIIKDGVIPEDFAYSSSGYLPYVAGIRPPHGVYSHISGIDLVEAKDGTWYVLEDNLRIPSGASYPLIARELCRRCSPRTFEENHVVDNRNYGILLKDVMDDMNTGGINVVFTPGRYNAAYFEHAYLAEATHSVLAQSSDLFVEDGKVLCRTFGGAEQVGAIYRRISDEYLDPLVFNAESLIGIPGLMEAYRTGNVAIINAPGNGAADDKGIYYFVPRMIEYYLKEKPILQNAPTYLPFYEKDEHYVLENIKRLVIKDVAEAGGYGVMFGRDLSDEKLEELKGLIKTQSRRWIAQEVIDFKGLPVMVEGGKEEERKADLRAFVLYGKTVKAWPSGLTRFSQDPAGFIVNSSQGGGFKDTWILSKE